MHPEHSGKGARVARHALGVYATCRHQVVRREGGNRAACTAQATAVAHFCIIVLRSCHLVCHNLVMQQSRCTCNTCKNPVSLPSACDNDVMLAAHC